MKRKGIVRHIVVPLVSAALAVVLGSTASAAPAAAWSSSARYGSWSNGGYTLYNDVWGGGAGPQTIWANSYSNWGVWSNQPNTGGVKSYPNSTRYVGRSINSLGHVTSNFNVSVPGGGSYETTYDVWDTGNRYETMLWMDKTGAVGPIGSYQTTVSVGGHSWNVYKGWNGNNTVFSFVQNGNSYSGSVDVLSVLRWIESRGWFGNITLGSVQFGYEITSSSGGLNFTTNSYSVSYG
jgi:hypothetical protein